jgi:uncharacterized oligopeptide transporter (OPT) family protein
MTVATLSLTCLIFLTFGMTSPADRILAICIGGMVCIAASNGGTTSQDLKTGYLVGATPRLQQWAIIIGALTSALVIGITLMAFNKAGTIYSSKPENLPSMNVSDRLPTMTETETYDGQTYHVWRVLTGDVPGVEPGRYLVNDQGQVKWLVDPAITGRLTERDDGTKVNLKFEAPKTQVMGIIINGVLGQKLNWGLVLMGAMIAVTLELCGIPSLAFAVGVYVQMSVSVPIFIGGIVRWSVERWTQRRSRRQFGSAHGDDAASDLANSESSPGVLLASGYIAGGTLGGVLIAFLNLSPDALAAVDQAKHIQGTIWDAQWPALVGFAVLIAVMLRFGLHNVPASGDQTRT